MSAPSTPGNYESQVGDSMSSTMSSQGPKLSRSGNFWKGFIHGCFAPIYFVLFAIAIALIIFLRSGSGANAGKNYFGPIDSNMRYGFASSAGLVFMVCGTLALFLVPTYGGAFVIAAGFAAVCYGVYMYLIGQPKIDELRKRTQPRLDVPLIVPETPLEWSLGVPLDRKPVRMDCPNCDSVAYSIVEYHKGVTAVGLVALCCLLPPVIGFLILLVHVARGQPGKHLPQSWKDVWHRCPKCGFFFGIQPAMGWGLLGISACMLVAMGATMLYESSALNKRIARRADVVADYNTQAKLWNEKVFPQVKKLNVNMMSFGSYPSVVLTRKETAIDVSRDSDAVPASSILFEGTLPYYTPDNKQLIPPKTQEKVVFAPSPAAPGYATVKTEINYINTEAGGNYLLRSACVVMLDNAAGISPYTTNFCTQVYGDMLATKSCSVSVRFQSDPTFVLMKAYDGETSLGWIAPKWVVPVCLFFGSAFVFVTLVLLVRTLWYVPVCFGRKWESDIFAKRDERRKNNKGSTSNNNSFSGSTAEQNVSNKSGTGNGSNSVGGGGAPVELHDLGSPNESPRQFTVNVPPPPPQRQPDIQSQQQPSTAPPPPPPPPPQSQSQPQPEPKKPKEKAPAEHKSQQGQPALSPKSSDALSKAKTVLNSGGSGGGVSKTTSAHSMAPSTSHATNKGRIDPEL